MCLIMRRFRGVDAMAKSNMKRKPKKAREQIVIDEKAGLVFSSEDELYDHFLPQIQALEQEYFKARSKDDIQDKQFGKYERLLSHLLDDPDEVWEDSSTLNLKVHNYVGHFS